MTCRRWGAQAGTARAGPRPALPGSRCGDGSRLVLFVAGLDQALLPLLEDFSDDVRIGATRALAALAPGEAVRDGLIQLLLRDKENARVRGEVLEALVRIGADVKGYRPSVEALLVEPFYLDREGQVKKRGSPGSP